MVFTAKDLSKWENFPKGLRVLLLDGGDGDGESAGETRSKLESMDYIVSTFTDESEALSAVFKNPESFHIAIVEVNKSAENESFKFLEAAKEFIPTIMISTNHCIKTTMNCIALGAVEFLQKPLSSEKLMNIWQHVVHKAFNDGRSSVSESLKPVKKSVVSTLHLDTDMTSDEKDPAPSTPQLKQVSRLLDGDENVNSSTEKESVEDQDIGESKSVDTTTNHECNVIVKEEKGDSGKEEEEEEGETEEVKEKEEDKTEDLKSEKTNSPSFQEKEDYIKPISKSSGIKNLSSNKASRKKVDWTQDLHNKFVEAVELLGVDNAIPSRILELMKVNGLTRHNVASHLQKFRMHRRNILPKVDHNNQRWIQSRENHRQIQRHYNGYQQQQQQHRPVMAYPVWGLPSVHHPPGAIPPLWPPPLQASGQLPQWHWQPPYHPTVNGNAWGCPVGPPMTGLINTPNTNGGGYQYSTGDETGFKTIPVTQPDEEMIDQVVKEAISKPWLPLPLGLKPPSADSVLAELSRQGISAVPSSSSSCHINGSHRLR